MMFVELLERLDGVHPRGTGRWMARCPAHPDKNPSLSVREGDRGLLLHCFSGCTIEKICESLNLRVPDLFNNAPQPRGARPTPKPVRQDRKALALQFELAAVDRRLRAARIIEAVNGLDLPTLDDGELDRALNHVAQAHADVERAELFEHVADTLRMRDYSERINRERQTHVA